MNRNFVLAGLFAACVFIAPTWGQEGQGGMSEEQAKEMQAWMEASMPNEHHKILAQMEGEWTYDMKWYEEHSEQPMETKGKCSRKMIMDGRYLVSTYEGEGMMPGMPFRGISTMTYDNVQKKYVESWIDNMSTMIMISEGQADESGKKITMTSNFLEPTGKKAQHKWESTMLNNNKCAMMAWDMTDGTPRKMLEMTMERSN